MKIGIISAGSLLEKGVAKGTPAYCKDLDIAALRRALTDIPSGGGSVRHMVFDPKTHAIWFGTDTQNIGRARLPD